jgi:hypothetical protein
VVYFVVLNYKISDENDFFENFDKNTKIIGDIII